jgi:hypothetical protein
MTLVGMTASLTTLALAVYLALEAPLLVRIRRAGRAGA